MNILNRKQYQRGVGLIEVLIALVVIAVGVIAVLGLQGTLMSGSATTKARNEAVALAREKTEELRNAVEIGQFDKDLKEEDPVAFVPDPDYKGGIKVEDGSGDGIIIGVNAQFTRSWKIMDVDSVPNTRELVMQVIWDDAQGVENTVELNTLIAYASPLTSALSQEDSDPALVPGGPDTGYEGLHDDTPMDEPDADLDDLALEEDGDYGITDILRYSNGHVQVRIWDEFCAEADMVRDADGDPIVNPANGSEKLCVAFTAFGGTLLRFDGTVYMDLRESTLKDYIFIVKATSPAYCALKPKTTCADLPAFDCVEYQCYASGDCSKAGGVDCPDNWAALADSGVLPDLNGGWYGKTGHFLYDPSDAFKATSDFKVCMSKEWVGSDPVDNATISRSYYSLRSEASPSTLKWREGINQSHSCHNTLIVEDDASEDICDKKGYDKMITEGVVWNSFKDDKVIRELAAGDVNNVLDADRGYCDLVAIYGSIVFPDYPDLGVNEVIIGPATGVFESLETGGYPDFIDGECVTQWDTSKKNLIYACNYVNTDWTSGWSWSGDITARGTMSYEVGNTITLVKTSYVDRPCTVTNTYDSLSPGRYSEGIPKASSTILCE